MQSGKNHGAGDLALDRRPLASRRWGWTRALAAGLARRGVAPNAISLAGMAAGIGAGVALGATALADSGVVSRALLVAGVACIQARLLCNLLDGLVAVEGGRRSPVGELYNEVPDRVSDGATIIGAGYAIGGWPEVGYVAAILAVLTAYVRTVGKGVGAGSDYGGPMAKQQRMALLSACCLYVALAPDSWRPVVAIGRGSSEVGLVGMALGVIALGSALTCVLRLRRAGAALRARASAQQAEGARAAS